MMTRIKIYSYVLILPVLAFFTFFIVDGHSFYETLGSNWYHVIPGVISAIFGIEIFKDKLLRNLKTQPPWYAGFKFTLKLWLVESIVNLITNLIEVLSKNTGPDVLIWSLYLISVSVIFYSLLAIVSSVMIGAIIGVGWSKTKSEGA